MAAAEIAVVRVTQPVFDTKVEPGNADNKALAFCLGSIWDWDWDWVEANLKLEIELV